MKKIFLLNLLVLSSVFVIKANEANDTTITSINDTTITSINDTTITSINDIIEAETKSQNDSYYKSSLQDIWGKNTYLNICYNTTELSSKELTTTNVGQPVEFKNDWGLGIQWGHTYNFHKRAIGDVLFFGLNFTWMDLHINKYKDCSSKEPDTCSTSQKNTNVPWQNKKTILGYGMSVGPALTLYPFSPIHNKNANKIRLQTYFHVGYGVSLAMITDAKDKSINDLGHGLYTSFGASLTWSFIGVGYEWRNDSNMKYKCLDESYDTSKIKMKEKSSRVYLQFRF